MSGGGGGAEVDSPPQVVKVQQFQAGKYSCLFLYCQSFIYVVFEVMYIRPSLSMFCQPDKSVNILIKYEFEVIEATVVVSQNS